MDIDLETSEALYEKLLQLECESRKKLKAEQKESQLVRAGEPGSSWYKTQFWDGYFIPVS